MPDLSRLAPLLADPAVEKVFHRADADIPILKRHAPFEVAGIFDTEVAARFCGRRSFSLQALLESEAGVRHFKDLQRCDWSRRPISPAQERYLVEDVLHLLELRDRLQAELVRIGRDAWAREEFGELALVPAPEPPRTADFMRVKGARDLATRDLAVLAELFRFREELARRADLPLFKVIQDEVLVELAVRRPRDASGLTGIRGVAVRFRTRAAPQLLEAIRRGETAPPPRPAPRPPAARRRWTPGFSGRTDRLKAWRTAAAGRTGLEPGLLLPNRLIEEIAADPPADLEGLAAVPGIRRWRVQAVGREILDAAGR